MTVLVIDKDTFSQTQYNNVTNIAYESDTNICTITASGTSTYDLDDYLISIIW